MRSALLNRDADDRITYTVVDMHAAGEICNVIVAGAPDLPGETAFEKMKSLESEHDWLRRSLLMEPRGASNHWGAVLVPTSHPDADVAALIMTPYRYPTKCGHGFMCIAGAAIDAGLVAVQEPVTDVVVEVPAGLVRVRCRVSAGRIVSAQIRMEPAFILERSIAIDVPSIGTVTMAIGYGGIFYGLVPAGSIGVELVASNAKEIVKTGLALLDAVNAVYKPHHPTDSDARSVANMLLTGDVVTHPDGNLTTISAAVLQAGRLDRSPTGAGSSTWTAQLHADGAVKTGAQIHHTTIFGTSFDTNIVDTTTVGVHPGIVVDVTGAVAITSRREVIIDPSDPIGFGHMPLDLWP